MPASTAARNACVSSTDENCFLRRPSRASANVSLVRSVTSNFLHRCHPGDSRKRISGTQTALRPWVQASARGQRSRAGMRACITPPPSAPRRNDPRAPVRWRRPRRRCRRPSRRRGAASRAIGITLVIGSTPDVSTSSSCLTQSRMPESSVSSALASSSRHLDPRQPRDALHRRRIDLHGSPFSDQTTRHCAPHS